MKFKVEFANGRCTTISCDSNEEAKKELLSVQKRFNSKIISVNNQPIEKLALGGVLLGTILGGILGNSVAKSGVKKTAKTISKTTSKTISKTKKGISEFRSASSKSKKFNDGGKIMVKKNTNNPNFITINIEYEIMKGSPTALGKQTMSKQMTELSSIEAYKKALEIAKKIELKYNIEDIEVTDLENGIVQIFAVSNDFVKLPISELQKFSDGGGISGFTNDTIYTKDNISIQRIGGSTMWNVAINKKPKGRILGAFTKEQAFKKVENQKFSDGGSITDNYRYAMGGMPPQLAIADQISKRLPATTAAIDKKFAERVNPTRPSMWEDRGLQKMAIGGKIGQEITFKHWTGDIRTGVIKEDLGKGNFEVSSGFGNVLVNAEDFISPSQKMAKGGYTTPSYNIKTTGVYRFATKGKTYILKSYLFERQNDTEDLIQIQDELRGELGAIIIKNSVWSKLSKGLPVRGISSKGNIIGTLTRIADTIDANKYSKGGSTNERNFVNKSEDYEVRYARKNNPSRVGYRGNKKYELGGGIDLFEDYDKAPPAVAKLMEKYEETFEDGDYEKLAEAHKEFEKIGYTFDYYLDGVAYDLRPIGTKGKAE